MFRSYNMPRRVVGPDEELEVSKQPLITGNATIEHALRQAIEFQLRVEMGHVEEVNKSQWRVVLPGGRLVNGERLWTPSSGKRKDIMYQNAFFMFTGFTVLPVSFNYETNDAHVVMKMRTTEDVVHVIRSVSRMSFPFQLVRRMLEIGDLEREKTALQGDRDRINSELASTKHLLRDTESCLAAAKVALQPMPFPTMLKTTGLTPARRPMHKTTPLLSGPQ